MKILIVSDTHKKNENYFKVLEMHHPDMVIHCGDAEGSEYALSSAAKTVMDDVPVAATMEKANTPVRIRADTFFLFIFLILHFALSIKS